jgi:hypothetical protein
MLYLAAFAPAVSPSCASLCGQHWTLPGSAYSSSNNHHQQAKQTPPQERANLSLTMSLSLTIPSMQCWSSYCLIWVPLQQGQEEEQQLQGQHQHHR